MRNPLLKPGVRPGFQSNSRFQRVRRRAIPCGQWPLMKTNLRIGFQFCGCAAPLPFHFPISREDWRFPLEEGRKARDGQPTVFLSIAKKYSTGIFFTVRSKIAYRRSPRARTPAAYFKARSRPFATPFSLSVRYTFQPPTGWESTSSAQRVRAVRRSWLC